MVSEPGSLTTSPLFSSMVPSCAIDDDDDDDDKYFENSLVEKLVRSSLGEDGAVNEKDVVVEVEDDRAALCES